MDRRALLLTHPSPAIRYLVLTRLFGPEAADEEVNELRELREHDPFVCELRRLQSSDGAFSTLPQDSTLMPLHTTAYALAILGYFGFEAGDPAVDAAASYVFRSQAEDGSWPMARRDSARDGYDAIPLQTAIPLRGLCAAGLAGEPAVERGIDWLLEQRLPDGAWPTGRAQGSLGYVGGYRRLPHSRWGCRSNTTGAVAALALHPIHRDSEEARGGLDHLLSRETLDDASVGFEVARLSGNHEVNGFITHFAQFDIAFLLGLAARCGASPEDSRISRIVDHLHAHPGLIPCRASPGARHWVTYDVEMSLTLLRGDWKGTEIHTPYRSYPRDGKRY